MTASEEILESQLQQTYSPELALAAYIPLTTVFGRLALVGYFLVTTYFIYFF